MTKKQIILGILSLVLFGAIFVFADYLEKGHGSLDWLGVVLVLGASFVFFLFQKTIEDKGYGSKRK